MTRTPWTVAWTVGIGLGLSGLARTWAGEGGEAPLASPLVVHEWGTFTSMSGVSGTGLEGLQHEEEALPEFVYSRREVRECPLRGVGWKGLEVPASHVTRKMETPVLYVHSATPRSLRVRVDMVGGLISQWYPVTDLLGPPELSCEEGPLDLRTIERSILEWDVDVLPKGAPAPAGAPQVAEDDPWAFAREVDASWLTTRPRAAPARQGPVEAERYLFYRGLGTFDLPFGGRALKDGIVVFQNRSLHDVAQVIFLEVGEGGASARYTIESSVAPGSGVKAALGQRKPMPIESVLPGLEADMGKILQGRGLFADEARAMVRTWSRSWFRQEGLRCIYVVPRQVTDAILPLVITPAPDRIVRVLVGRLELVKPETRDEVETALLDLAAEDASRRGRGAARLARLGRFEEAHLREIVADGALPEARTLAAQRLAAHEKALAEVRR
jgi:hypothetical protein